MPEYLFLVDRTNYHDQQAKFFETLIDCLKDNGVLVTSYYFDGDPRLCFPAKPPVRAWTLPELASKYERHHLVICADGMQFFNPISGDIESWITWLQRWSKRTMLTPVFRESPEKWDYRETELKKHIPLLSLSLRDLQQIAKSSPDKESASSSSNRYPKELEARSSQWLQSDPPDSQEINAMLKSLQEYLKPEGYHWLKALAVYPELSWYLTLFLGSALNNSRPVFDKQLLVKLLRLPWFRHGYMPTWLRERLLQDLTESQHEEVRSALKKLLVMAIRGNTGEFEKTIENKLDSKSDGLANSWLWILAKQARNDSSLRDSIFLTTILGGWYSKVGLMLTGEWRNYWRNLGLILTPSKENRWLNTPNIRLPVTFLLIGTLWWTSQIVGQPSTGASVAIPRCNGAEMLLNGGFENNDAWYFGEDPNPGRYIGDLVHSGARSVLLGNFPSEVNTTISGNSSLRQLVTIPANAMAAQLRWWHLYGSQAQTSTVNNDSQQVLLLSPDLKLLRVIRNVYRNEGAWSEDAVDLSDLRGQTFYIYFNLKYNGDGQWTWMYVDDVTVRACF